jgi:hypothetical protein
LWRDRGLVDSAGTDARKTFLTNWKKGEYISPLSSLTLIEPSALAIEYFAIIDPVGQNRS